MVFREIHAAAQNLVQPNKGFADAVDARQVSTFPQLIFCYFFHCDSAAFFLFLFFYNFPTIPLSWD